MKKKLISENDVRLAAYYNWLNSGRPEGAALDNWVSARRQLEGDAGAPRKEEAPKKPCGRKEGGKGKASKKKSKR